MLVGEKVALRARHPDDVAILHAELYENVDTRSRSDDNAWRPRPLEHTPFAIKEPSDRVAVFSVVDRADDQLAGSAIVWDIDLHSRAAHLGLGLRPAFRGRGLGTDIVRVLCDYGFRTLGLHRLQIETLADNDAMLSSARRAGFVREGLLREAGWVQGRYLDLVLLGLLEREWRRE